MPSIIIDIRRTYTPAEEVAIMDAVFAALVEAFGVPARTRNVVLNVHPPHRFAGPPDAPDPERCTNISIFALAGRSSEAKRRLYRGIATRLAALGIPAGCLLVRLHEMAPDNFAVRGADPLADVTLDYRVDV